MTARIESVSLFEELESAVDALGASGLLSGGQVTAVLKKLANAQKQAAEGHRFASDHVLTAFIHQVQALIDSGRISGSDGNILQTAARALLGRLGGD